MTTMTTLSADPLRQPSPHLLPTLEEPTISRSISQSSCDCEGVSFESLNATELIDNSTRQYNVVRLACGVTVHVGENVLESYPGILDVLNYDILGCVSVLPGSTHKLVRRTKIWINHSYAYGPLSNPTRVWHSTAHHYPGWLLCVRDKSEKANSIEIYNAGEYQRMRLHYNGHGLLLHELCHIIHQQVLPGGLDNAMVIEFHKVAKESGKYSKVLRRDWALKQVDTDMAYCLVNHKEFFSEISVAYLADCYYGVEKEGTTVMAKCSPPFISIDVIERIQQQAEDSMWKSCTNACGVTSKSNHPVMLVPHCSKFFPFTKDQLRRYDPRVFNCFVKLWEFIESWEDAEGKGCDWCDWF
ncbi:hypothetical protein ACHAWU_001617 [Discostella pseudostelligera]|uniref:SprT-like domain-containing protein n=1 Tax=Discostella pseudostelligera TaxID=259834 RepID=A0ABD3MGH7_9STRA